jgi:hypothetical protein
MNKSKGNTGCLANFLLSVLGIAILGSIIIAIFPKTAATVSTVGGVLIIMFLVNSYTDMQNQKKKKEQVNSPIDVTPIDVTPADVPPLENGTQEVKSDTENPQ